MTEKATTGEPFDFNEMPTRDYLEQRQALIQAFCTVRLHSEQIASPFSPQDQQLQSMPEASPVKWHLAHTSWFFETFILAEFAPRFECFDEHFCYLFNSYYNALGRHYPRPLRGLMSRPELKRVMQYRKQVTTRMLDLLHDCDDDLFGKIAASLLLGLNHEQQHQELIMTDISHAQWIEFIDGGGYDDPMLWLADGWAWRCEKSIRSPLYWYRAIGGWYRRTLAGAQSVPPNDPVSHLSYYIERPVRRSIRERLQSLL